MHTQNNGVNHADTQYREDHDKDDRREQRVTAVGGPYKRRQLVGRQRVNVPGHRNGARLAVVASGRRLLFVEKASQVICREGAQCVAVLVQLFGQLTVGRIQLKQHQRAVGSTLFHVHVT